MLLNTIAKEYSKSLKFMIPNSIAIKKQAAPQLYFLFASIIDSSSYSIAFSLLMQKT